MTTTTTMRIQNLYESTNYAEIRCLGGDLGCIPRLTGNFSSSCPPGDMTTAIFSSHRFILVSRSPYFHNALSWSSKQQPGDEPPTLNLPSPPFTPASLHFTLGFMLSSFLIVHTIYPPLSPSSEPPYTSHSIPFTTKSKPG
jgi:hypothetical protein